MYSVGDILIKIDVRARFLTGFNTQHHAMIVLGVTEEGYPIVAHMTFTDAERKAGMLVREECMRGKDLILIHCVSFSDALREEIRTIALQACEQNQLYIDLIFLEREYNEANLFRQEDSLDINRKVQLLRKQPLCRTNVLLNKPQMVSCHDFVLSTIQLAYERTREPLPEGFAISPRFAWSDIFYAVVDKDPNFKISPLPRIIPNFTQMIEQTCNDSKKHKKNALYFFDKSCESAALKPEETKLNCCTM